jgi:glycosyltransferase involved in cell wall biosynthesis
MSPLVTIAIPTYNGSRWIEAALDSALAQTHADWEVLVVDNASTDDTRERVRARADERIRLERQSENDGAVPNHNRCVLLARGELIKFLHQDDRLKPGCVERMAAVFAAHPRVGMVFAPREVEIEDPNDGDAVEWARRYGTLHHRFRSLDTVNRGRDLLGQYLPALRGPTIENWIGEPTSVMVRRSAVEEVGFFNERLVLAFELELWLRIMTAYDVGFVDEPLSVYRHHSAALTAAIGRSWGDWLDLLWIHEALLASGRLEPAHERQVRRLRRRELLRAGKRQLGRLARGNWDLRPFARYLGHRLRVG